MLVIFAAIVTALFVVVSASQRNSFGSVGAGSCSIHRVDVTTATYALVVSISSTAADATIFLVIPLSVTDVVIGGFTTTSTAAGAVLADGGGTAGGGGGGIVFTTTVATM